MSNDGADFGSPPPLRRAHTFLDPASLPDSSHPTIVRERCVWKKIGRRFDDMTTATSQIEHATKAHTGKPRTLRELRASGWTSRSVKAELRENLTKALRSGETLFPGISGYDDTVIPEVVHALCGARYAVPGREGTGQEPADAGAGPFSIRCCLTWTSRLRIAAAARCTRTRRTRSRASARRSSPSMARTHRSRGGGGRIGTPSRGGAAAGTKFAERDWRD